MFGTLVGFQLLVLVLVYYHSYFQGMCTLGGLVLPMVSAFEYVVYILLTFNTHVYIQVMLFLYI